VLGGVICSTPGAAYKSSDRRAVDDGAASLLAHPAQLVLHTAPDATEVDGRHPVKILSGLIGCFRNDILDSGIVVGCIQPAESGDRLLNHCFYLSVISYVATNSECFVTPGNEFSSAAERAASSFQSANTTEAPDSAKAFAVARPSPDPAPVTSATLFSKDMFITSSSSSLLLCG
jgi:hypothetical protein